MQPVRFQTSEAYIHAIVGGTPDALVAVDLQGRMVAVNRAAENLFDLPASAMLGYPIAESRLPESLRRWFSVLLRGACTGESVGEEALEVEGVRANRQAWVAEARFFSAGAGSEAMLGACLRNITGRRQAEEKALRLSRILRTMIGGNQALVRATSEDDLFQAMCRALVEIGGYRMAWIGQAGHDKEKSIRPLAHAGDEAGYLALAKIGWGDNPYGRGPSGMSIRTGTPQFNNDIKDNPVMAPWKEAALERGYISSISLPLKDNADVFGALTLYAGEPNAFGPDEVALLVELAVDISYGIAALRTRRDHDEMERTLRLVNERKQAEDALRESEERFRGIYQHAGTGIAMLDLQGQFESCNPAYSAMIGYTEDELGALKFSDLVHPDDREADMAENRRLLAQEIPSFEIVNRFAGKNGQPIWVHKHISLLRDAAGNPTNIIALVTDMTERKRYEERIGLLMHEVNHRAKNILAVVAAVARQTLASKPEDFIGPFGERIQALAASQDLLVKNEWHGVDLQELVRSQLAHFKELIGTRIGLDGPSVLISAAAAQTLGMALHELATNAGKYGALSTARGRVDIEWSCEHAAGGEKAFAMSWRERGGPAVTAPARPGFGSIVISRMAMESLSGKVDLDFAPAGLFWRLQCPFNEVIGRSRQE